MGKRKVTPSEAARALGSLGGASTWAKMTPAERTARAFKMLAARARRRKAKRTK